MLIVIFFLGFAASESIPTAIFPLVINTWSGDFSGATQQAWNTISTGGSNLDAIVSGCSYCEVNKCGGSVGWDGHPDEIGEVTLDAQIMDGRTYAMGCVSDLRQIKNAIGVARAVMDYSTHTMLAGESATNFALMMGFQQENLTGPGATSDYDSWMAANCQPNFRKNVSPDPSKSCGPYTPLKQRQLVDQSKPNTISVDNHDTISMVVIDANGSFASGTSTNGADHKIPGRVGDGPIPGSGSYSDNTVGGCGSTGDGDSMMRYLPCVRVLEFMRGGDSPTTACQKVIKGMQQWYPNATTAVVAVNIKGEDGGASHGWGDIFTYSVVSPQTGGVVKVVQVKDI